MTQQDELDHANTLRRSGRLQEAADIYLNMAQANPANSDAWHFLGIVRAQQGQLEEACDLIEKAVRLDPHNADALSNHALVLSLMGRFSQALAQSDAATQASPGHAEAWNNRGLALQKLGRFDDALASFDRALANEPRFAEAWNNRGNLLSRLRRWDIALASYDKALAQRPDYADAWNNHAHVLKALDRFSDALAGYERALAIQPTLHAALMGRSAVRWRLGRYPAAIADLERAAALDPARDYALGMLLHRRMHAGLWEGLDDRKAAIDAGVREGKGVVDPFVYQAICAAPADLQACAQNYAAEMYPAPAHPALLKNRANAKIRIGYVSGEFSEQATAFLTAGLYELHDKSAFEISAWDNGRDDGGPTRKRLEAAFGGITSIAGLSDAQAAEKIAAAQIDILVDLNGYFGAERTGLFAARPAPLQVNYLGFPGTMGAPYMDYLIADRFIIPPEERRFYTEQIVYMPGCYQANDARRPIPRRTASGRADNGLPEDGFVFCNFNQSYKLTPESFDLWMRILRRVEGSVLWLLESNTQLPGNLRREAERRGVAGSRLIFAPVVAQHAHLERLALADLFLDGLPYNAHTTASDALWAGVPLITLTGTSFAGRVATSLLHAAGLPELVTESAEAYEALAVLLATTPRRIEMLRQTLTAGRTSMTLFDTARYCRHLEQAYRIMWNGHCNGEPPKGFSLAP